MSDDVLEKLSSWTEKALGIKAADDALLQLKGYLEKNSNPDIFNFPGALERLLSSPEERFNIARFLTINETYFFREEPHFDLLLKKILPRFARRKKPFRVCSAATSMGCEAYSLAMLMDYYSRTVEKLDFQIEAFDVSRDMIEIAKQGRYSVNAFRHDGNRWRYILDRYLTKEGETYIVSSSLKERIHFFPHNIMDGIEPLAFDLILFRNALIYFSPEGRRRILDFLVKALTEEGVLLFGISEIPSVNHPFLQNKQSPDAFYFQKISALSEPAEEILSEIPWEPRQASDRRATERRIFNLARSPGAVERRAQSSDRRTLDSDRRYARNLQRSSPRSEPIREPHLSQSGTPHSAVVSPPKKVSSRIAHSKAAKNIASLLEQGEATAEQVLRAIKARTDKPADPGEDELIAAVICFLSLEDFAGAEAVLAFAEEKQVSAFTKFLRGEYNYLSNKHSEAETFYKEASALDGAFWPAFYRASLLAAEGNRTLYEVKIKKALESVELGKDLSYECFIGGFSPDYYRRILEKRLSK
ncbi:CheR family methyltransferase [Treponema primitia]|uniref:CheR family methyltransferase n=1 Tax=Treponema primitia TaxID=88058 RepID=UPI00025557F8|nr:CheR family methyltransferase [Treponema primitia]